MNIKNISGFSVIPFLCTNQGKSSINDAKPSYVDDFIRNLEEVQKILFLNLPSKSRKYRLLIGVMLCFLNSVRVMFMLVFI